MKSFSLSELKKELILLPPKDLAELCVALAKYKKDNKEYLGYLLVDSNDKPEYVLEIKQDLDDQFELLSLQANLYYVKKTLRKILRNLNKYCRYANDKALTCDLHIYFCKKIKSSGIAIHKSQLLINLYEQQIKKINKLIGLLHEDLQADYLRELSDLDL